MSASIRETIQKIKGAVYDMKEEILVSLIIVAVGFASYGLGMLSVTSQNNEEIRIVSSAASSVTGAKEVTQNFASAETSEKSGQVVASKSGKKYHFPWCGGAKQIAEKNKITFDSIEEARKAGY